MGGKHKDFRLQHQPDFYQIRIQDIQIHEVKAQGIVADSRVRAYKSPDSPPDLHNMIGNQISDGLADASNADIVFRGQLLFCGKALANLNLPTDNLGFNFVCNLFRDDGTRNHSITPSLCILDIQMLLHLFSGYFYYNRFFKL